MRVFSKSKFLDWKNESALLSHLYIKIEQDSYILSFAKLTILKVPNDLMEVLGEYCPVSNLVPTKNKRF